MIKIDVDFSTWKDQVDSKSLSHRSYKLGGDYRLFAIDGPVYYYCHLDSSDNAEYETDYLSLGNDTLEGKGLNISSDPAFTSKVLGEKKLFQRVEGKEFPVTTASNDNTLNFVVPYPSCKITGLEIIGGELGDKVILKILDSDTGMISGVPNYLLNTFGGKDCKVNVAKDYYVRESSYDADLYQGLYVSIDYETVSDKTVYINYVLHELKD